MQMSGLLLQIESSCCFLMMGLSGAYKQVRNESPLAACHTVNTEPLNQPPPLSVLSPGAVAQFAELVIEICQKVTPSCYKSKIRLLLSHCSSVATHTVSWKIALGVTDVWALTEKAFHSDYVEQISGVFLFIRFPPWRLYFTSGYLLCIWFLWNGKVGLSLFFFCLNREVFVRCSLQSIECPPAALLFSSSRFCSRSAALSSSTLLSLLCLSSPQSPRTCLT